VFPPFSKVWGAEASRAPEQPSGKPARPAELPSGKPANCPRARIGRILIDFGRNLEDFNRISKKSR